MMYGVCVCVCRGKLGEDCLGTLPCWQCLLFLKLGQIHVREYMCWFVLPLKPPKYFYWELQPVTVGSVSLKDLVLVEVRYPLSVSASWPNAELVFTNVC